MRKTGHKERQQRFQLLRHINEITDKPLVFLSLIWVIVTVIALISENNRTLETISLAIWALFVLDFVLEFTIAPSKVKYFRSNWLTALSLLLPAFRIFRIFRWIRLLRTVRSISLVRIFASVNRGFTNIRSLLAGRGIAYVLALSILVILSGAAGILYFENPRALSESGIKVSSEAALIDSYGDAIWWTAMLLTTIGSEYWPLTAEGRILAFFLALYSFGVFGYVTATIASLLLGKDVRRKA